MLIQLFFFKTLNFYHVVLLSFIYREAVKRDCDVGEHLLLEPSIITFIYPLMTFTAYPIYNAAQSVYAYIKMQCVICQHGFYFFPLVFGPHLCSFYLEKKKQHYPNDWHIIYVNVLTSLNSGTNSFISQVTSFYSLKPLSNRKNSAYKHMF